jgi:hypothetical protein
MAAPSFRFASEASETGIHSSYRSGGAMDSGSGPSDHPGMTTLDRGSYDVAFFPYTASARFSNAAENRANAASNIAPISRASIRLLNS